MFFNLRALHLFLPFTFLFEFLYPLLTSPYLLLSVHFFESSCSVQDEAAAAAARGSPEVVEGASTEGMEGTEDGTLNSVACPARPLQGHQGSTKVHRKDQLEVTLTIYDLGFLQYVAVACCHVLPFSQVRYRPLSDHVSMFPWYFIYIHCVHVYLCVFTVFMNIIVSYCIILYHYVSL